MLTLYYVDLPPSVPDDELQCTNYIVLSLSLSSLFSDFCGPDDERNLLYVAASRAKSQLILSPMCIAILKKSGVSEPLLFSFSSCVCVCVC